MEKIYISQKTLEDLKNTTVYTRTDLEDLNNSERVISGVDDESDQEKFIDNLTISFHPKSAAWNIEHEVGFPCVRLTVDSSVDHDDIDSRREL